MQIGFGKIKFRIMEMEIDLGYLQIKIGKNFFMKQEFTYIVSNPH